MSNTVIKVRSGNYIDLVDPKPDQFVFDDIAAGLSKICRFGAQIPKWYTVAEHSWWCYKFGLTDGLSSDLLKALLMHDATEAFLGDVVKPLKLLMPEYNKIEDNMAKCIGEKYNVDFESNHKLIKKYDNAMLIAERDAIFLEDGHEWIDEQGVMPLDLKPYYWNYERAQLKFTTAAYILGINTKV